MLSAGSCIEWLCSIGLLSSPEQSAEVAAHASDSGGVFFVPALSGLGTPEWDFGARGLLIGLESATSREQIVYAVLEGIAQRTLDLVLAIERDAAIEIEELRVDGGMSRNSTFVQLVANAIGRPVLVSKEREATTLGAGLLAGSAIGLWGSLEDAVGTIPTPTVVEPTRHLDRDRWLVAKTRAAGVVPALSLLKF